MLIDIKKIIEKHSNCLDNESILKAYLNDYYPENKRESNIATIIYSSGILADIKRSSLLEKSDFQRIIHKLENEYGIIGNYSIDVVKSWAEVYDIPYDDEFETTDTLPARSIKSESVLPSVSLSDILYEDKNILIEYLGVEYSDYGDIDSRYMTIVFKVKNKTKLNINVIDEYIQFNGIAVIGGSWMLIPASVTAVIEFDYNIGSDLKHCGIKKKNDLKSLSLNMSYALDDDSYEQKECGEITVPIKYI